MFIPVKNAIWKRFASRIAELKRDRSGNFALTFALLAVPLCLAMGASVDYVQAMNTRRHMQDSLDAALIAAVNSVGTKDADAIKAEMTNWMAAQAASQGTYELDAASVVIDTTNNTITAKAKASVDTTFMRMAGKNAIPVLVASSVIGGKGTATKNAFSMYLVLDRSGSMDEDTNTTYTTTCYKNKKKKKNPYSCTLNYTKLEALKLASEDLMTQMSTADPDAKYVRTGAVSYDNKMQTPTDLDWGVTAVNDYVEELTAGSATNSGEAFETAYDSLILASENAAHLTKNGNKTPSKYIVFMTDGANNVGGADTKTKLYCDKARTAGIQVYTVAFMAPTAGQELLKYCATNSESYFPAENTADLVAAFALIGETASKTIIRLTQ